MAEQHIAISAYTDTGIFTGFLSVPSGVRLSDFINLPAQFLHFKNDTGNTSSGESMETITEIHINKKAIYLSTSSNENGKGGFTQEKVFPYVNKIPVNIKIFMTDYEISGYTYGLHEDALTQMLEKNQLFLPCTDVYIHNLHNNEKWHSNFVAVNRNNISVLQKVRDFP